MFRNVPFSWFYRRPKKKGKEGPLKVRKFRENRKSKKILLQQEQHGNNYHKNNNTNKIRKSSDL